jgi:hypothetical protein
MMLARPQHQMLFLIEWHPFYQGTSQQMPPFHHFSNCNKRIAKHGAGQIQRRATWGKKVEQKESKKVKRGAFANDD